MKIAQTSLTLSDQGYGYGMKVFLHLPNTKSFKSYISGLAHCRKL